MNETVHNWQRETDEHGMCWLTLNVPGGANVLSHAVLEELDGILDDLHQNPPHGLVFASGKNGAFIAGADVGEFSQIIDEQQAQEMIRRGQAIMDRIAALPFPTLALINGYCLGGGLELSLACDYRIAQEGARTRIGLPEVKLGIHPGFGGSVRSIQRIGPLAAMNLMLSGRTVDPRAARRMGLVDEAVPERQLRTAAVYYLMNRPPVQAPDWKGRLANLQPVRPLLARIMRRQVAARAPRAHYPAPYALLDLWVEHGSDERAMLEAEAESVARLIVGQTARNLVRVFELQNRLKSLGREGAEDIHHVHVIGGGVMGGDIAAWCALQGFRVTVQDQDTNALGRAVHRAQRIFKRRFKRDRLAIQAAMDRFIPDNRGVGLRHADVVIEAIFENLEAKQQLYRDIEAQLKPDALLATNTSSIRLEALNTVLSDPGRLVGLHFFNPVAQMPLVEIVQSEATHEEIMQRAQAFARRIDKLPLPVRSAPGFLVNRILMPYLLEAIVLESEGVPRNIIDRAAKRFGMPMGPLELADTVGLDICLHVGEILAQELGGEVPSTLRRLVEAGRLGRKSGRGFYEWKKGKPVRGKRRHETNGGADLEDRLMLRLINEAVAVLREGIVGEADLLDAGVIFGTGFAPFRGGPLYYLNTRGRDKVKLRLEELAHRYGERFSADAGFGAA